MMKNVTQQEFAANYGFIATSETTSGLKYRNISQVSIRFMIP